MGVLSISNGGVRVLWTDALPFGFAAVLALLILGSIAALILSRLQLGKWADLGPRMRSWWVMAVLVGGALLLGW